MVNSLLSHRSSTPLHVVAGSASAAGRGCIVLAVANPVTAVGLAGLAAALAHARQTSVLVVNVRTEAQMPAATGAWADIAQWPAVASAVQKLEDCAVANAWLVCQAANVGRAIRSIASSAEASLILLGWRGVPRADGVVLNATLKDLLRDPATNVVVVGGRTPEHYDRVLVAHAGGPHSRLALQIGLNLVEYGSTIGRSRLTALHVLPADQPDARLVATQQQLDKALGEHKRHAGVSARVARATSVDQGIIDELKQGYDLVIMGTSREALIDRVLFGDLPQRVANERLAPVVVARSRTPWLQRMARTVWYSVYDRTPTLTTEEQIEVSQAVRKGVDGRHDFYTMLVLAAVIAALGLLLNSPAVIIGAMIVAPLMSAIEGISLGIVEGDRALLRNGAFNALGGSLLAVFIGLVIGWLIPGSEPTSEVMARTQPSLLDLGVALAAGAAAAYAFCRKEVAAALAGVAIAVALVPPLATIGIGLSMLRLEIAQGATLLFATNLIAIAAASALVYMLLGFGPLETQKMQRRVLRRSLWGVNALLLAVTIILAVLTLQAVRSAQLTQAVADAVHEELRTQADVELVRFDQISDTHGVVNLTLTVTAGHELSPDEVSQLQRRLAARFGQPVALSVAVIPTIRLAPEMDPPAAADHR